MVRENVALAPHTTLQIGGPAAFFAVAESEDELVEVVQFAKQKKVGFRVLGGGSNVLVPDEGVAELVILNRILGRSYVEETDRVHLTVGAGEMLDDVVAYTVSNSWWGMENLSHIPGTIGATPVQNVGAYGVEVKDLITTVRALNTETMQFVELHNEDCRFGYRDSMFKHPEGAQYIVTGVTYRLLAVPQPNIEYRDLQIRLQDIEPTQAEIRETVINIRLEKFPDWHTVGTAGSFFKNPIITASQFNSLTEKYPELPGYVLPGNQVKVPLGWILDKVLGIKGVRSGVVGSYDGQALVLVNYGGATARELTDFADDIAAQVRATTGIEIEWEVTRW